MSDNLETENSFEYLVDAALSQDYNKENDSEYKRLPNTWNLWGTTSLDKLPENTNLKSAKNITDSYFFYGTDPAELGNIRER